MIKPVTKPTRSVTYTSQKFIDSRDGEIVTTILLSQIPYFDKYNGDAEPGEYDRAALARLPGE